MKYRLFLMLLLAAGFVFGMPVASAVPSNLEDFNQQYDTNDTRLDSCDTCHISTDEGSINAYAMDYSENGGDFASIEMLDSDEDGYTNIDEINALTFPGDPEDNPGNMSSVSDGTNDTATGPLSNASERLGNASERAGNASERLGNASERISNASERAENVSERISNVTDTDEGQQSPGFGGIVAVVGLLAAVYLVRLSIRK